MSEIIEPLEPEHFYHIYNHAVGDDDFFKSQNDYYFFLEKFQKYVLPFFDVYAYTLMPNHFHLVLHAHSPASIKETLEEFYKEKDGLYRWSQGKENIESAVLSKALGNLFDTYARYFNTAHNRKGTLFTRSFKRKLVTSETHLQDLIKYVHLNPVEANFCKHPSQWKHSSFNSIVGTKETFVKKAEVIDLFFNLENFIFCNTKPILTIGNQLPKEPFNKPFDLPF